MPAVCDFAPGSYLVVGPNVGPLQYYSHLPIIAIAVALAFFVLFHDWKALSNRLLSGTIIVYALWVFFDSIIWATNRSDVVMFMWSLQVLIEPLVYLGGFYLLYVLLEKKEPPFIAKIFSVLLYLPIIIAAPTTYNLSGFDLTSCLANEGIIAHYYSYFFEVVLVFMLLGFVARWRRNVDKEEGMRGFYLTLGVMLLLVAFAWGNIVGSFTDDWQLGQYGLFGLPVFSAFLVYTIVRYRTFNIKIIGAGALVAGLLASSFALLFVDDVTVFRGVAIVTFILSVVFGIMLIRSVRQEVKQRERIEELARNLEVVNKQQVVLIHFITHQIKGFVAKSRNIFSMIMDGDYGTVPETMRSVVEEGFKSDTKGANTIQEILNAANIKSGKVAYANEPYDVKEVVEEIMNDLKPAADAKGLAFTLATEGESFTVTGDRLQMLNALKNLVDNSIKYTLTGSIALRLIKKVGKVRFEIQDTGVGITLEDMARLFTEGGHGKESQKINVDSTGFGLFIVKNIIEAHKGKVWAESEGAGKGSTFIVELPA